MDMDEQYKTIDFTLIQQQYRPKLNCNGYFLRKFIFHIPIHNIDLI